jgi:hypothetical protein
MIEAFRRHIGEDNDHDNKDEDDKSSSQGSEQQKEARAKGAAGSGGEGITPIPIINPTMKSHFQLQVKTSKCSYRDAAKLEQIIKAKERDNKGASIINISDC